MKNKKFKLKISVHNDIEFFSYGNDNFIATHKYWTKSNFRTRFIKNKIFGIKLLKDEKR